jgi:hypothetical protein
MHFGFRQIVAAISGAAVIFCCSCEKHRLGEDPEVQKERASVESASAENPGATKESLPAVGPAKAGSTSEASPARTSPTPAEFFPETTPSP